MESCSEVGDLSYRFFVNIPADKWASGAFHRNGRSTPVYGSDGKEAFRVRSDERTRCALGHLSEAIALDCSYKTSCEPETIGQRAGQELMVAVQMLTYTETIHKGTEYKAEIEHQTSIPTINDNNDPRYQHGVSGEGARLNILHAMLDVKAKHLEAFHAELDAMLDIARAQVKEVVVELGFADLLGRDARISEVSVRVEADVVPADLHDTVTVKAGYVERKVKAL